MVADVTSNKKLHPVVIELIQYFGFKFTVIVPWTKRCKTKYYIFLYHEDPPKKQEIQQIVIDHLLILTPKTSWSYTENVLQKILVFSHCYYSSIRYCFTVSKNLLKGVYRVAITTDEEIRDEKLQLEVRWAAAKIFELSSYKIDKYEFLTGEETLSLQQRKTIEQAKFTYLKAIKGQREKQREAIKEQGEEQLFAFNKHERKDYFNVYDRDNGKKVNYFWNNKNIEWNIWQSN